MFPRSLLFLLLATNLGAAPSFDPPKLAPIVATSDGTKDTASFESPQNSNDDKFTLRGTVVNSLTAEPIRGALVQIYFNGQNSMLTGSDGKFEFAGLPTAQITITARKPGFFADDDSQSGGWRQMMAITGPNSAPVVLRLVPEGLIYGKISEENGEPIERLPVSLLVRALQNGRRIWQQRAAAMTDEDGNFRIAELQPGDYYLSAGPGPTPVAFSAKSSQPGAQGFPLVYYPAASELAAAAPITITPGKKAESNLTLSPQPFYRLSGTVSGYAPGQSVSIQVHNAAGIHLPYGPGFDPASGTFRIPGIPAGSYTLQAQGPDGNGHTLTATVPLTVSANLSGVHVILLPAVVIPIETRVISARSGANRLWESENFSPVSVQLVSRDSGLFELRYGSQPAKEPGATAIELQNIPPGTYSVEANPQGPLYVQSAVSGTTNLLDSELSVAPGSAPQPIEITLRDDFATLNGKVSSNDQPWSATVMAFSEHASTPPRIQPVDQNGAFQLSLLPPGAYKIVAVDHPDRLEYKNPEALRKYLSNARDVNLSPEQSARIDLELVKVGE